MGQNLKKKNEKNEKRLIPPLSPVTLVFYLFFSLSNLNLNPPISKLIPLRDQILKLSFPLSPLSFSLLFRARSTDQSQVAYKAPGGFHMRASMYMCVCVSTRVRVENYA